MAIWLPGLLFFGVSYKMVIKIKNYFFRNGRIL